MDKIIKTVLFAPCVINKLNKKAPKAKKHTSVKVSKAKLFHFGLNV